MECEIISQFMKSPLVSWARTFDSGGGSDLSFTSLADGVYLHDVLIQIDPRGIGLKECLSKPINRAPHDSHTRLYNLALVLSHIKLFYKEILGHSVFSSLPDIILLSKCAERENVMKQLRHLILLVLGCAVQSSVKEDIITNIKQLPIDTQHSLMQCIQEVTDDPEFVWPVEWSNFDTIPAIDRPRAFLCLLAHSHRLAQERDNFHQEFIKGIIGENDSENSEESIHHIGVQLADAKGKLRRAKQQLDEKNEFLSEIREELDQTKDTINRLRQENVDLIQDARAARAWRDEADIYREKAEKVDTLEAEIVKYKDKMTDIDFYKSRVEELREDNRILSETKEMLEEQLLASRRRADQVLELENSILQLKQSINHHNLEKDSIKEKLEEAIEENANLQLNNKQLISESAALSSQLELNKSKEKNNTSSFSCDLIDDAEQRVLKLELANQRLETELETHRNVCLQRNNSEDKEVNELMKESDDKILDALEERKTKIINLETTNLQLKNELTTLSSSLAELKTSYSSLVTEKQELESHATILEQKTTHLKSENEKQSHIELELASSNNEIAKLKRMNEASLRKIQDGEKERHQMETHINKLERTIDTMKISTRRLNDVEKELTDLEASNDKLLRENKSFNKEVTRLKHSMEEKDLQIDEAVSKISTLERNNRKLSKEMDGIQANDNRLKELQISKRELEQKALLERRTLAALREELVMEKVKTQQLVNQLDTLKSDLTQLGLNPENLESPASDNDHDRFKALESILNETLKRSNEIRDSKIRSLEDRLADSTSRNKQIISELMQVKADYELLLLKHEENIHSQDSLNEILKLKEQISRGNEEKGSLENEVSTLTNQSASYREQVLALQSQVTSLSNQNTVMSQHNAKLQGDNARLQVENTTQQSQSASLIAQNSTLQTTLAQIETDKSKLSRILEERACKIEQLEGDNEALQKLHEQLTRELDACLLDNTNLKHNTKTLKTLNKQYEDREKKLTCEEEELLKLRDVLEDQMSTLKVDSGTLTNLRAEHSRLKEDFRSLFSSNDKLRSEYKSLQGDYKQVKTNNNSLKLKLTELDGELNDAKDQICALDVEISKHISKCQVLHTLNVTLEDDRKSLMAQVGQLLMQYHDLLTQTLEDKHLYHQEEKKYTDKLNNLRRQKEKLEEKIFDQYRKLENSPTKKKGFTLNLVKRVRKAGTDFINKVPRKARSNSRGRHSSTDSASACSSIAQDDSNDSETDSKHLPQQLRDSTDDVRSMLDEDADPEQSAAELHRVGSRRPLYVSDTKSIDSKSEDLDKPTEDNQFSFVNSNAMNSLPVSSTSTPKLPPRLSTDAQPSPQLPPRMQNKSSPPQLPPRIRHETNANPDKSKPEDDQKDDPRMDKTNPNSVWYEYGCV